VIFRKKGDAVKNADRISALIILGVCALFFAEARDFSPYSALFPRVVIVILAVLAVLLLIVSYIRPLAGKVFDRNEISVKYLTVLATLLLMIAWVAFISFLGFLTSSIIFFSLVSIALDRKHKKPLQILQKTGLIAVTVTGFFLFFSKLLYVPFPTGLLL
jgi:hypothetical protein